MKLISILFLIVSSTSLTALAQAPFADRQAQQKLDSRIPSPDREKYKKVRDGNEWLNPFLIVRPDGIEIRSRGTRDESALVHRNKLRKALVSLSVSAWPYGRVIGAQHTSIRNGRLGSKVWRKDEKLIAKNETEVKLILASLGIELNWWPSN